jgi:hypothetical protein
MYIAVFGPPPGRQGAAVERTLRSTLMGRVSGSYEEGMNDGIPDSGSGTHFTASP